VTLSSIGEAVITIDAFGVVVDMNPGAETLTGWPSGEAAGKPVSDVFSVVDRESRNPVDSDVIAVGDSGCQRFSTDHVLIRRDGVEVLIEDCATSVRASNGKVMGAVIVFRQVGESRKAGRTLAHLAQYDFLTGLPNRTFLTERLYQAIALARRHGRKVGLLFVDLDNFKVINDTMGHVIGDQALISVAQRLRSCVRETDTVCRQGGDEFIILLSEIENAHDAHHIADKLAEAFSTPHVISGNELYITVSVGVIKFP
jgi:diguanylate cyclase (GGDEF)-like protein/PAS domain S-box-containing protein